MQIPLGSTPTAANEHLKHKTHFEDCILASLIESKKNFNSIPMKIGNSRGSISIA